MVTYKRSHSTAERHGHVSAVTCCLFQRGQQHTDRDAPLEIPDDICQNEPMANVQN